MWIGFFLNFELGTFIDYVLMSIKKKNMCVCATLTNKNKVLK